MGSPENYSNLSLEEKLNHFLAEIDFRDLPGNKTNLSETADRLTVQMAEPHNGFYNPIIAKLFEKSFDFSEEKEEEIIATLCELLNNSIEASYQGETPTVDLTIYYGENGLVFYVKDTGNGFNLSEALDRDRTHIQREHVVSMTEIPEAGTKGGGYGLYCLEEFADAYSYNEKGNEVIVKFKLSK